MKKNILFIDGVRDSKIVKMVLISANGSSFDVGGSCNLFSTLKSVEYLKNLLVLDANPSSNINIRGVDLIVNQIAEFDTFKNALAKIDAIIKKYHIPCINKPQHIANTRRDTIYNKLRNIDNLSIAKSIKIKPLKPLDIIRKIKENLNYPVIIREIDTHGSDSTYLIKSDEDVKNLYCIALDAREYYLTQYHEYKDDKGLYKKYRLAVVNGEVFIRHCIISENWMIHHKSSNTKYIDEEIKILKKFDSKVKAKIKPIIKKIYKEIGLEYFGIDCSIDKYLNIFVFEINANMNMLEKSDNHSDIYIDKIMKYTNSMILNRANQL